MWHGVHEARAQLALRNDDERAAAAADAARRVREMRAMAIESAASEQQRVPDESGDFYGASEAARKSRERRARRIDHRRAQEAAAVAASLEGHGDKKPHGWRRAVRSLQEE